MTAMSPMVASNVDLRDFAFFPLDAVRLRDSILAGEASAEEFRAAVLLWCVAWHQVPAASLPVDDKALARYVGYGRDLDSWMQIKAGALRGFQLCVDGRLYHSVIAEKAMEAWDKKLRHRHMRECARIKKSSQRERFEPQYPSFDEWKQRFESTGETQWVQSLSLGTSANVPRDKEVSVPRDVPMKSPVRDRDRDRDRDSKSSSSSDTQSKHAGVDPATRACALMEEAGAKQTNASSPDLAAAFAEGVTIDALVDTAREAIKAGKTNAFAWAITTARRRHAEGAKPINGKQAKAHATPSPTPIERRPAPDPVKFGTFLQGIKELFGSKPVATDAVEATHDPR